MPLCAFAQARDKRRAPASRRQHAGQKPTEQNHAPAHQSESTSGQGRAPPRYLLPCLLICASPAPPVGDGVRRVPAPPGGGSLHGAGGERRGGGEQRDVDLQPLDGGESLSRHLPRRSTRIVLAARPFPRGGFFRFLLKAGHPVGVPPERVSNGSLFILVGFSRVFPKSFGALLHRSW